jgi:hypothetical protein
MRIRLVASAVAAATLAAAAPVLLTLHLNGQLVAHREAAALLAALFLPLWGMAIGVLLLVSLALSWLPWWRMPRQSPLPKLPGFTTLATLSVALAAGLFWQNLLTYRHSIPVASVHALAAAAVAVSASALVLLGVLLDVALFPLRGRGVGAALVVLASAASVALPLALRRAPQAPAPPVPVTSAPTEPLRRVILVGMDGLGVEFLQDRLARGRLPVLAAVMRRGAFGPLAPLRPTETAPIWTTIVTGRLPRDHGVKGSVVYRLRGSSTDYELLPRGALVGLLDRLGFVSARPVTHVSRKRRALWNELNAFGLEVGVVRLPGTHPVERVRGFMVSDYFHLIPRDRLVEAVQPVTLVNEVAAKITDPADVERGLPAEFQDAVPRGAAEAPGGVPWRRDLIRRALAPDLSTLRVGAMLRTTIDPPFFAEYFFGFDVVGHSFLRFAEPERFGNVSPEEVRSYGRIVDAYAAFLSRIVADLAAGLRPREILLVVSGYGMEAVSLGQRLRSGLLGGGEASGTHVDAPEGFILALGDGVRAGARFERASVLDLTPTVLYLLGLPVARDMEGRVATEILDEDFARSHPVAFIPSYESLAVAPIVGAEALDLPPLPEEEP